MSYGPYSGPSTEAQTFVQRLKQVIVTHGQRTQDLQLALVTTSCQGGESINPLSGHDCTGGLGGQLWLVNNRNGVLTKVAPVRTSTLPGVSAPPAPSVEPFVPEPPTPAVPPVLSIALNGDDMTLTWTAPEPPSDFATSTDPIEYRLYVSPTSMNANPYGSPLAYDGDLLTFTYSYSPPTGHWFIVEAITTWGPSSSLLSNEVNSPIIETDDATDVT